MNCNTEDDLSLLKIWRVIIKYKTVIFFITLAFIVVSFFLYRANNIQSQQYKAELFLLEPSSKDVESLKRAAVISKYVTPYKKEGILNSFIDNLNSIKIWEGFYLNTIEKNNVLLAKYDASSLRERLNIFQNTDNKEWSITLIGDSKKIILKILNEYLAFVDKMTTKQLVDNEIININHRIFELQDKISNYQKKIQKFPDKSDLNHYRRQIGLFSNDIDSLKNISFSKDSLHTVNVVQKAYPVKIKFSNTVNSVVILSAIFGFLFSLVLVFLLDFIKTSDKR